MWLKVVRIATPETNWEVRWALRETPGDGPYVCEVDGTRILTFPTLAQAHDYARYELQPEILELPDWAGLTGPPRIEVES